MSTESPDWTAFHRAAVGRPSRELLRRTLGFFAVEQRAPGIAVDLGCGSGADTLELLRRGWLVHAVDAEESGLELLRQSVPEDVRSRLHTHARTFEAFDFPDCDLIWAGYSLPFCSRNHWPALLHQATAALRPRGRIVGDLFGEKHAFAIEPDVIVLTESEARATLKPLTIEAFDVEDGFRPSGNEITRWHAFGFAARKAATGDA